MALLLAAPLGTPVAPPPPIHDQIDVGITRDPAIAARVRWMHLVDRRAGARPVQIGGRVDLPMFAGGGAGALTVDGGSWVGDALGVGLIAGTGLSRARDALGSRVAWTSELTAMPGLARPGWQAGAAVRWRGSLATHLRHSELVENSFADRYPESRDAESGDGPVDGWYVGGGWRVEAGLRAGITPPSGLVVRGGLGVVYWPGQVGSFPDLGLMPFTASLSGGWRW